MTMRCSSCVYNIITISFKDSIPVAVCPLFYILFSAGFSYPYHASIMCCISCNQHKRNICKTGYKYIPLRIFLHPAVVYICMHCRRKRPRKTGADFYHPSLHSPRFACGHKYSMKVISIILNYYIFDFLSHFIFRVEYCCKSYLQNPESRYSFV